jgi:hypothetical protein
VAPEHTTAVDGDAIVERVREHVGTHLRAVVTYSDTDYELIYLRSDLDDEYGVERIDRIHRELVLEGIGREYLEDLFDAGPLRCSMHGFEEAMTFHFADPDSGLFVSVDSAAEVPLKSFVADCHDALGH